MSDTQGPSVRAFRLALVQMRVVPDDKEGNLRRAEERIAEAARSGAEVVLLPETMDAGWTSPSAGKLASAVPEGDACRALAAAAQRHRLFLCAGLTERDGERVFNAAVLLDPSGRLLLHHRKLYELTIAHDLYEQGDRLGVARTPLGTLGLMICADGFADDLAVGRTLGFMGADVILSPCAWAVPADYDNERTPYGKLWLESWGPVARQFRMWIAGASNVGLLTGGPWAGRPCIGCSLVIGPDGQPALRGPYGPEAETILYIDIHPTPRPARGNGWRLHWEKERRGPAPP